MGVTVVNPLQFLRELFTINGAGTLIRRGSRIDVHDGWQSVDPVRLRALFASAFGRDIRDDFFTRPIARTFVEENYRGAAVVAETAVAPYLTKFAVERQAQGDGLGTEIWSLVTRDYPAFFWRSARRTPSPPGTSSSATASSASPSGTSSGAASRSRRSAPRSSTRSPPRATSASSGPSKGPAPPR